MPETTRPQDAPDDLTLRMADALNTERWGSKHDAIGRHDRHGFYAPCGICRGAVDEILALLAPVVKAREAEIERRVREQVATESAALAPADLAEILDYVAGRGDVRVVREETLDRAFAALKATLPAGEAR